MATQKVRPDPGFVDRQHDHRRRKERNRKIGAFVVVAAIGVAAVVVIVTSRPENATAPADEPTPVDLTAIRSARNFANALGAFETDEALTYLASDADISALLFGPPEGAEGVAEELRLQVRMLEAQGFGQILGGCEQAGISSSGRRVRCTFDFHLMGSDRLGLGPFTGSWYDLTIRDGAIVRASVNFDIDEFSPQVWEPFADWVAQTHPDDVEVMYSDPYTMHRLSEESVRLWDRRVPEYVAAQTPQMVEVAERFMEARNASDIQTALSLLAEDGATIKLMIGNLPGRNMPSFRADRDELALALEAERISGVRYGSMRCELDARPTWDRAPILCSYELDSKLRQIAGLRPVPYSMRIGVHDGRVDFLGFPALSASFPGENPAEVARFVQWAEATHPEVGGVQGGFHDGELFRIMGQEVVLILTPDAIELLERYLDEYERAVG